MRSVSALGGALDGGVRALHLLRRWAAAQVQHLGSHAAHGNLRMNAVPA